MSPGLCQGFVAICGSHGFNSHSNLTIEIASRSTVWPMEGSHISCAQHSSANGAHQPPRLTGPQTEGRPCKASSYLPVAEEGRNRTSRKYRAPHSCHALAESLASRFLKLKSNILPRRAIYVVKVDLPGLRKCRARLFYYVPPSKHSGSAPLLQGVCIHRATELC